MTENSNTTTRKTFQERVRATMKSRDTEGPFELYVTRTPGYILALFFKALHWHPIAVTLLSMVLGVAAGWCYGRTDTATVLAGIGLLLMANWLDCADGQLARMTDRRTLIGRILDGFAGDVWFFFIYFFICLRLTPEWGVWIWVLCAWAGFYCHARQCALADYYRNIHLLLLTGRGEVDNSERLTREMQGLSWNSREWFHKLYLFFYISYTRGQERQTPCFQRAYAALSQYGDHAPQKAVGRFLDASRPLMKHCNILTFDARAGVLFAALLVGQPWIYPVVECTLFEGLRWYVRSKHERASIRLLADLQNVGQDAPYQAGEPEGRP